MMRFLDIALRIPLTGVMFVFFGLVSALLSWIILPLARLREKSRLAKDQLSQRIVCKALNIFHFFLTFFRLVRYKPWSHALPIPDGPVVVVANHPTLVDVTAITATYPNLTVVVKKALFLSPAVGGLLRACRHIPSSSGGALAGAAVFEDMVQRIQEGMSVLVFPEGTRSPAKSLRPFSRGAFEVAARTGATVVPLFLTCDPPTLMKGQKWYEVPERTAELRITPLTPIDPSGWNGDSRALCKHVRDTYVAHVESFYHRNGEEAVDSQGSRDPGLSAPVPSDATPTLTEVTHGST